MEQIKCQEQAVACEDPMRIPGVSRLEKKFLTILLLPDGRLCNWAKAPHELKALTFRYTWKKYAETPPELL